MLKEIRPAIVSFAVLTVVTGILYPLAVTGIAQTVMPAQANGSLILKDGKPIGSALIGQSYSDPKYFWGRPSATSPMPNNGAASSGSNLGPTNPALKEAVAVRVKALHDADPGNTAPIPVDLVTASGSGLDPHISPAAAEYQVARVARVRGIAPGVVSQMVATHVEPRQYGVIGEPRVNVLQLNLALDALQK
jgi:K+-transporting ATPase ATPase C chain